jgi:hypothetical protein
LRLFWPAQHDQDEKIGQLADHHWAGPVIIRRGVLAVLRWLCLLACLWAMAIHLTGGFSLSVAGQRISSHNPIRPLYLAAIALALHAAFAGLEPTRRAVLRFTRLFKPWHAVAALAALTAVTGLIGNSGTASGADSYGYVSQADLWLHGRLKIAVPVASQVPWPDGLWTFAPLGYRPAAHGEFIVPAYAPGLPMLMAAAKLIAGHRAMFWIVPLLGALLVAMSFMIGRRLESDGIGVAAAWLVATSPVLLYMLMLPMSDVPVAAFWAIATWCALAGSPLSAVGAGLSASMAVLIRPNLVPLAGVFALWLGWRDLRGRRGRRRFARTLGFLIAVVPGCAAVALLNAALYGSPVSSGYGSLRDIYSLANFPVNVVRYGGWLIDTHTVVGLAGLVAVFLPWRWLQRSSRVRPGAGLLALIVGVVIVSYCLYMPFNEWLYLRFLLPAWPAIFVATTRLVARGLENRWVRAKGLWVVAVVVLGVHGLLEARARAVYAMGVDERRYAAVAEIVRTRTEPSSIVFAMQHSGSLRYYGARTTIRYDFLDKDWLDRSVDFLRRQGLHPYILLDGWERAEFQRRFSATSRLGRLEMPPVFIIQGPETVYLYDLLADPAAARAPELLKAIPAPRNAPPHPAPTLVLNPVSR